MKRYIYLRAEFLPESSSAAQIEIVKQTLKTNKIPVFIETLSASKRSFLEGSGFAILSYNSIPTFNWNKPVIVDRDVSWWTAPPKTPNALYLLQTADGDILFRGPGYKVVDGSAVDTQYSSMRIAAGTFRAPLTISDSLPEIDYNSDKTGLFHLYLSPNNSLWRGYAGQLFVSDTEPTLSDGNYVLSTEDSLGALYIGVVSIYHEVTHESADKKYIFDLVPALTSSSVVVPSEKNNIGFEDGYLIYRDSPIIFSFPINKAFHPRTHGFSPGIYNLYYIQGDIFQTGKTAQIFLYQMEPTNQFEGTISWDQFVPNLVNNEYRSKMVRGAVLIGVCNARYGSLVSEEDIYPVVTELLEGEGLKIEYDGSLSYSDDNVFRTINATDVFCASLHWSSEGVTGLPLYYDVERNDLSTQTFFDEGIYHVYISSSDPNWIYLDDLYAADLVVSKHVLSAGQSFFPNINNGRVGLFCVGSVKISYRYDDPYGSEFPDPKGYVVPYYKDMPLRVESFDTDQTLYYQGGVLVVATVALPTTLIDYPIYLRTDATILYPQYNWKIFLDTVIVDSSYDLDAHINDQSLDIPVASYGDMQSWSYDFHSEKQSFNISDEFGHIGGRQAKRGEAVICRVTIDAPDAVGLKQSVKAESWTLVETNNTPPRVQRMGAACYYKGKLYYMFGYADNGEVWFHDFFLEGYGYATHNITTFDLTTKLWGSEPPYSSIDAYCTGIVINDYLYAIGGAGHLVQYDPINQTFRSNWTNFIKSAVTTDGDQFYNFTGEGTMPYSGYPFITTGYEIISIDYGGTSFTPVSYTGVPNGRKYATAHYLDGRCYIFGGTTETYGGGGTGEMDIFDVKSRTFVAGRACPRLFGRHASVLYDGRIYYTGNLQIDGDPTSEYEKALYIYDIAADSWSLGLESLVGRLDPMMTLVGDQIYVWGGQEAVRDAETGVYLNKYCNKLEVYQIPTRSASGTKIDPKSKFPVIKDIGVVFSRYKLVPLYEMTTTTTTTSTTTTTITTSTLTTTETSSTTTTITTKSTQTMTSGFTTSTEYPTPWTRGIAGGYPRTYATAGIYNDKLYIWGGYESNSNSYFNFFDIFDFQTNTWSVRQFSGGTPRAYHVSVVHNGKMYIMCGSNQSSNVLTTDIFDFETNTWSVGAPTNFARQYASAAAVTSQNKIYVFGGESTSKHLSVYDIMTNSWSTGVAVGPSSSLTYDTITNSSMVAYGENLYIFGGSWNNNIIAKFFIVNTVSGAVTINDFTVQGAREQHMAVLYGDYMLILRGYSGSSGVQNSVAAYKISLNRWSIDGYGGDTSTGLYCGGLYQGKVYCWRQTTGKVEIYDAERAVF
jgi:hypothetical protein